MERGKHLLFRPSKSKSLRAGASEAEITKGPLLQVSFPHCSAGNRDLM